MEQDAAQASDGAELGEESRELGEESRELGEESEAALETVPRLDRPVVSARGGARWGTWRGGAQDTSYDELVRAQGISSARRTISEKRWQWFGVMDARWALGGAIVRGGYMAQVFIWWFDRLEQRMIVDTSVSLPIWAARVSDRPSHGRVAEAERGEARVVVERGSTGTYVGGSWGALRLALEFDDAFDPFVAVCPVRGGHVNITQKQAGLRVRGYVTDQLQRWDVEASTARGMLDYTHGLLARETAWRWAIGAGVLEDGREFAFNLVEGFNEGLENVLWVGDPMWALGAGDIGPLDNAQGSEWMTKDQRGALRLELTPDGERSEHIDYGLVRSIYTQPLGIWGGTVLSTPVKYAHGVAEDHVAKW